MFYRKALLRCADLEDEVAQIYRDLAATSTAAPEDAEAWSELARKETIRARMLRAVADLSSALEDDGPFLVQVPVQLRNLERVLENVKRRLGSTVDGAGGRRCAEVLETGQHREIHAGLLELAEPEVRRVLRLIDSEIKSLRRGGSVSRSRARRARCQECA